MNRLRPRMRWMLAGLAVVALAAVAVGLRGRAQAGEHTMKHTAPAGPADNAANTPVPDGGKFVVENPTKTVLRDHFAAGEFVNPGVEPGRVRWHPTFAAACAAARLSKKPVLLFQMMGKLDDQFC